MNRDSIFLNKQTETNNFNKNPLISNSKLNCNTNLDQTTVIEIQQPNEINNQTPLNNNNMFKQNGADIYSNISTLNTNLTNANNLSNNNINRYNNMFENCSSDTNKKLFNDSHTIQNLLNSKILSRLSQRKDNIFDLINSKRKDFITTIKSEFLQENNYYMDDIVVMTELEKLPHIINYYIDLIEKNALSGDDLYSLYESQSHAKSNLAQCMLCSNIVLLQNNKVTCLRGCYEITFDQGLKIV